MNLYVWCTQKQIKNHHFHKIKITDFLLELIHCFFSHLAHWAVSYFRCISSSVRHSTTDRRQSTFFWSFLLFFSDGRFNFVYAVLWELLNERKNVNIIYIKYKSNDSQEKVNQGQYLKSIINIFSKDVYMVLHQWNSSAATYNNINKFTNPLLLSRGFCYVTQLNSASSDFGETLMTQNLISTSTYNLLQLFLIWRNNSCFSELYFIRLHSDFFLHSHSHTSANKHINSTPCMHTCIRFL